MADPVYSGEAMLLNWNETARNGRTITLTLEEEGDRHPFKGLKYGQNGQRFAVVIVPMNDDQSLGDAATREDAGSDATAESLQARGTHSSPAKSKAKKSFDAMPRSQQAGMLCDDEEFQDFLDIKCGPEGAAEIVRRRCGVDSRVEFDWDGRASIAWDLLVAQFRDWQGNRKVIQQAEAYAR